MFRRRRFLKEILRNAREEEFEVKHWFRNDDDEWTHEKTGDRLLIQYKYNREDDLENYTLGLWTGEYVLTLYNDEEEYLAEKYLAEFLYMNDIESFHVKNIKYHPMMNSSLCRYVISQYEKNEKGKTPTYKSVYNDLHECHSGPVFDMYRYDTIF